MRTSRGGMRLLLLVVKGERALLCICAIPARLMRLDTIELQLYEVKQARLQQFQLFSQT